MLSVIQELRENSEPKNITQQHPSVYHIENVAPELNFFLFMTIRTKTFFTLVRTYFPLLSFFPAGHNTSISVN